MAQRRQAKKLCHFFYSRKGCVNGDQCTFQHSHVCPQEGQPGHDVKKCWWPHQPEHQLTPCTKSNCPRKTRAGFPLCKPCHVKLVSVAPTAAPVPSPTKCATLGCSTLTMTPLCSKCWDTEQDRIAAEARLVKRCRHCQQSIINDDRNIRCPCQERRPQAEKQQKPSDDLNNFPALGTAVAQPVVPVWAPKVVRPSTSPSSSSADHPIAQAPPASVQDPPAHAQAPPAQVPPVHAQDPPASAQVPLASAQAPPDPPATSLAQRSSSAFLEPSSSQQDHPTNHVLEPSSEQLEERPPLLRQQAFSCLPPQQQQAFFHPALPLSPPRQFFPSPPRQLYPPSPQRQFFPSPQFEPSPPPQSPAMFSQYSPPPPPQPYFSAEGGPPYNLPSHALGFVVDPDQLFRRGAHEVRLADGRKIIVAVVPAQ